MLNFAPMIAPHLDAASLATQDLWTQATAGAHQLWADFDAWAETTKLDRIDFLLMTTVALLFTALLRDYTNMAIIQELRTISKQVDGIAPPPLQPEPEPAAEPERARLSVDPPDALTQAMLAVLATGCSLTAKELRTHLPESFADAKKGEINSRLYKLMNRGTVSRFQMGTEVPTWALTG